MLAFYLSLLDTNDEKSKMEQLYIHHKYAMKVTALSILRCDMQADDAVHDTFVKLTRHLDNIEDVASCRARSYMCLAVRRRAYDMLRMQDRHPTVSLDPVNEMYGRTENVADRMAVEELLNMIKELPDIYQDVLEMKIYHMLSDRETADVLKLSPAATRKRLQRARKMLADKMQKRSGDHA